MGGDVGCSILDAWARVDLFTSCLFVRNDNSTVGLSFDCIFRQGPGRWPGYYAAVEIVAAIMPRTPDFHKKSAAIASVASSRIDFIKIPCKSSEKSKIWLTFN